MLVAIKKINVISIVRNALVCVENVKVVLVNTTHEHRYVLGSLVLKNFLESTTKKKSKTSENQKKGFDIMKHSWSNLKLETYPEQRATKQVLDALQKGKIPFRIIAPSGTYYVDPNGKHNAQFGIHTGVILRDRQLISVDTNKVLATRTSKLRILAYTNSKTLTPTWRTI